MPAKKPAKKDEKPKAPAKKAAPAAPKAEEPAAPPEAPNAEPLPQFVKEASPADRKAAVEALALDAGVAPILARAPWRKPGAAAAPAPAPEKKPEPEAPKAAPERQPLRMTKPQDLPRASPIGVSGKRPVLLDTNALMMQFQFHIDVERELKRLLDFAHEIVVPSVVLQELESLAKEAKGKDAGEARMALELAKTFKLMESPGDGDTSILRLAEKLGNAVVVTNDKLLRARLRAKDIPNIYMRSSAFLTLEGHVSGI